MDHLQLDLLLNQMHLKRPATRKKIVLTLPSRTLKEEVVGLVERIMNGTEPEPETEDEKRLQMCCNTLIQNAKYLLMMQKRAGDVPYDPMVTNDDFVVDYLA